MKFIKEVKLNKGFTLVELIVVLSLLLMILTAVYNFFEYSQKIYIKTETQNILQDEVNKVLQFLADDIRSAAKPDNTVKPIMVYKNGTLRPAGNRIDIYDYKEGKYYKTSYLYSDNTLKRGITEKTSVDNIKTASVTYEIILEGVQYPSAGELFTDVTVEVEDEINDRRHIKINLLVKDPHDRIPNIYSYLVSYTSRTKGAY